MKYLDLRRVFHRDGGNHTWGHRLQGLVVGEDGFEKWIDIPNVCIPDESPLPDWYNVGPLGR